MTQQEAYEAITKGERVAHEYFTDGEYLEMKEGRIVAEDGVNFSEWFWQNKIYSTGKWRII